MCDPLFISDDVSMSLGKIYKLCSENVELKAVRSKLEQLGRGDVRYILRSTDSMGQTLLH